jgi:phosphoenolpyruvate carboxykinase (ATP)
MNINHTRAMVRAALDGRLDDVATVEDPIFRVAVPVSCPDVPTEFLQPRNTWQDKAAYDTAAHKLAAMFAANFAEYADEVSLGVREAGPRVEA